MREQSVSLHRWLLVALICLGLCYLVTGKGVVPSESDWHLLAEFGSGSLALLIVAFCAIYYRAGGEAPAVLLGLAYLSPTLVAVFLMTILPVVLLASNLRDLGIFAGSTGALAFSMLMMIGSAFTRRPPREDPGSLIGMTVGVTLLSGAGAAGIMDLLASTYGASHLLHLDTSVMASIVAGTGTAATSYFCWKTGGRLNRRISVSQATAAMGHLVMIFRLGNPAFLVFSHATRILAQMELLFFIFYEIDDLMEEQKRLSTQYRTYRRALDSVPIGIVSIGKSGRIETVNKVLERALGITETDIVGKHVTEVAHLGGSDLTIEEWLSASAPEYEWEFTIRRQEGSSAILRSRTFPVNLKNGLAGGSIAIIRDVTEERRLEADLRTSERLAIAGDMARVVSSKMAEPVRRMKRELSSCLASVEGEAKGFLTLSLHEVERLESLMRDLCFLQGPRNLKLRRVSLGEIAQRVLEINHAALSRKAVTASIKLAPKDDVLADRYRIQQVITNVVRNAVEAVEVGGVISVETRVEPGRQRVALDIHNTGGRIPEGDLQRVFEPFFSTKSSGTGLGLSVCKRIVEDHGGEIRIRNEENGVLCTMALPSYRTPLPQAR